MRANMLICTVVSAAASTHPGKVQPSAREFRQTALEVARPLLSGGQLFAPTAFSSWSGELSWQAGNTIESLANLAHAAEASNASLVQDAMAAIAAARAASAGIPQDYEHFDDFGWWALGLVRGAVLLGSECQGRGDDVATAASIFEFYVDRAWSDATCSGGVNWGPVAQPGYKNAITNELFLALAGALYEATRERRYLDWAQRQWRWIRDSGLINHDGLINDGLAESGVNKSNCSNNGQTTWTYNQGVVLGGLASLYRATGDVAYLREADAIARASMSSLAPGGVLRESCEDQGCSSDAQIFKGVFVRHLWYLSSVAAEVDAAAYRAFLASNAASLLAVGVDEASLYGEHWTGQSSTGNAATQSAALDLFVAAGWSAGAAPPCRSPCASPSDAVGAFERPGWKCGGSTQASTEGGTLQDCQASCRKSDSCAFYTWTAISCTQFADAAVCQLDFTGCGTKGGCQFISGSRGCDDSVSHGGVLV